jgi:ethanolamine utilization protein EutQ (cupin superfamily)
MTVNHYTNKDAKFFQYLNKEIFVGDVLDPSNSSHMSAGYYRNKRKGEKNEWVVTYDEVLIVAKGALTIRTADGAKTAKAGEIIFLTKGTALAYEAGTTRSAARRNRHKLALLFWRTAVGTAQDQIEYPARSSQW